MSTRNKRIGLITATVCMLMAGCGSIVSSNMITERVTLGSVDGFTEDLTKHQENQETVGNGEEKENEKEKQPPQAEFVYKNSTYEEREGETVVKRYFSNDASLIVRISNMDILEPEPSVYIMSYEKESDMTTNPWEKVNDKQDLLVHPTWLNTTDGVWEAEVMLPAEDGSKDYQVLVEGLDKEGQQVISITSDEILFDLTIPVISIEYDTSLSSYVEDEFEYYNKPIDVVFNVVDDEIIEAETGLLIKRDGEEIDKVLEDKKTLTQDGEYEVILWAKDKGGHLVTTQTNKKIILDTTIDKPEIHVNSKKTNGMAIKGDVNLEVSLGDINLLNTDLQLRLSTVDNPNEDITDSVMLNPKEENGIISYGASFPREKKWDGTYRVLARIKDKAGNEETSEMEFVVNRFGSDFTYGDYLNGILEDGKVIKTLESDIEITEINPTKTMDDKLKILITRDGKPVQEVKFSKETKQVNSWWENVYVISRENFKGDGKYKVALVTEDEVSNIGELTPDKYKEIAITIDNTAPEITSLNWKREDEKIKLNIASFDSFGIRELRVYKNKNLIDTITGESLEETEINKGIILEDESEAITINVVAMDFAENESSRQLEIPPFVKESPLEETDIEIHFDSIAPEWTLGDGDSGSFPIWVLIPAFALVFLGVFFILKKSL